MHRSQSIWSIARKCPHATCCKHKSHVITSPKHLPRPLKLVLGHADNIIGVKLPKRPTQGCHVFYPDCTFDSTSRALTATVMALFLVYVALWAFYIIRAQARLKTKSYQKCAPCHSGVTPVRNLAAGLWPAAAGQLLLTPLPLLICRTAAPAASGASMHLGVTCACPLLPSISLPLHCAPRGSESL